MKLLLVDEIKNTKKEVNVEKNEKLIKAFEKAGIATKRIVVAKYDLNKTMSEQNIANNQTVSYTKVASEQWQQAIKDEQPNIYLKLLNAKMSDFPKLPQFQPFFKQSLQMDYDFFKEMDEKYSKLVVKQTIPLVQATVNCVTCEKQVCLSCLSKHKDHEYFILEPLPFICDCRVCPEQNIGIYEETDIQKIAAHLFKVVNLIHGPLLKGDEEDAWDKLVPLLEGNQTYCQLMFAASCKDQAITPKQAIQMVKNQDDIKIEIGSLFYAVLHGHFEGRFMMQLYQACVGSVSSFRAAIYYYFGSGNNIQDLFNLFAIGRGCKSLVDIISIPYVFDDDKNIQWVIQNGIPQKLFEKYAKVLPTLQENKFQQVEKLISVLQDLSYFHNRHKAFRELITQHDIFLEFLKFLVQIISKQQIFLEKDYEMAKQLSIVMDRGLMTYQNVLFPMFQWYKKGFLYLQKNPQDFDQEKIVALIQVLVDFYFNSEDVFEMCNLEGFYVDGLYFLVSFIYSACATFPNLKLTDIINYISEQTNFDSQIIITGFLKPVIKYVLQLSMIANGQRSKMNQVDWDDLCNQGFSSTESNVLTFEMYTCIRWFHKQYPIEVVSVINTCIDDVKANSTSQMDFFTQLCFQPDFSANETFLSQMLHFVHDIKPSYQKYHQSVISTIFEYRICDTVLSNSIILQKGDNQHSDSYQTKNKDNFEPAINLFLLEDTCQKLSEEQKSTFLPKCINGLSEQAKIIVAYYPQLRQICNEELGLYQKEQRPYSKAMCAIRLLRHFDEHIVVERQLRHSVLNQFVEIKEIEKKYEKPVIDLKNKLKLLKQKQGQADQQLKQLELPKTIVNEQQENKLTCSVCYDNLKLEDAVFPVQKKDRTAIVGMDHIYNFCTHKMHNHCLQKENKCPICKLPFDITVKCTDFTTIREILENIGYNMMVFSGLMPFEQSEQVLMKQIEHISQLQLMLGEQFPRDKIIKNLKEVAGKDVFMHFPASTTEIIANGLNKICPCCDESITPGYDCQEVIMCMGCGSYQHEYCKSVRNSFCVKCKMNAMLSLDNLVVKCRDVIVRAPYVNKFGQYLHTVFADIQLLDQKRLIECLFDIVFANSCEKFLTLQQVKQINEGPDCELESGDSTEYAGTDWGDMDAEEEEGEEEFEY